MLHHHYTSPHPTIQLSPRVGRCDNVLANLVNGPVVDTEYRVSTLEMGIVRVKHIYIYIYSPTIASHQRQELIVERMQSGKKLWRFSSFFLFFSLATREAFLFVSFSLESVYGNCTGMVEKNWIIVWLDGIFWCSNECIVFGFIARKLILLDNRFVVFCNQFEIKERIVLILY